MPADLFHVRRSPGQPMRSQAVRDLFRPEHQAMVGRLLNGTSRQPAARLMKRFSFASLPLVFVILAIVAVPLSEARVMAGEQQLTFGEYGHILTNIAVWSPDSRRIVYDVRSDPAGDVFDGTRIETVDIATRTVTALYETKRGAQCGVATYHPTENKVVFIHGPEHPTPDWRYGPSHRQGVGVNEAKPGVAVNLDARDLTPPFTPGALRGGSHVHVFSGDGKWVSFTYEDHLLAQFTEGARGRELNQRNVGVGVVGRPVTVSRGHPRNHDGSAFSVLVTRTTTHPRPGSDEIERAFEDAWVGTRGYRRSDGTWQHRALAFQGHVRDAKGNLVSELFIVDIPDNVTVPGDGPLAGTAATRPRPPRGTVQRRLTFTTDRQFPGVQGPRHWPRSAPDGSRIAFLMRDDGGIVQLWTISPNGGTPAQVTRNSWSVASAFSWSPDGRRIAHVLDTSVCVTDVATGTTTRLTPRAADGVAPRPEACVFSPDGNRVAYIRPVRAGEQTFNQVFACPVP